MIQLAIFLSFHVASVKVPFQKADRIVHGFITREEGGVPWPKGFHEFACPKRHSIARYVQLGPAYYHFHRNQRYGTHKAYRLIDNSPLIMLSRKFPRKRGLSLPLGPFDFSLFYVRGTRVLIFFTARLIFKGFFLFDDDSLDGLFFRILFRWIFEVS